MYVCISAPSRISTDIICWELLLRTSITITSNLQKVLHQLNRMKKTTFFCNDIMLSLQNFYKLMSQFLVILKLQTKSLLHRFTKLDAHFDSILSSAELLIERQYISHLSSSYLIELYFIVQVVNGVLSPTHICLTKEVLNDINKCLVVSHLLKFHIRIFEILVVWIW